ncbi:MAG: Gfo/Idh/MocA family oxidoreductase [Lachnospiraceae bacterium]|nr:Gfo/Idh/MocA family oxidoreductase [Lachnospiraceae bacterium]
MKYLIIGCGSISRMHAQALQRMGEEIAICDPIPQNLAATGEQFGIAERYTSYEEAFANTAFDAVIVCTPNHLHEAPSVYAMEHGADVLCEKPIAANAAAGRRMMEAAERCGRKLFVGYPLRFYPALPYVREILGGGSLGKIISVRAILAAPETLDFARTTYRKSYETGGGIIYDYTHEIDYLRYFFGEPLCGACFAESTLKADRTVDDNAEVMMKLENGMTATVHFDYIQERGRARGRSFEVVAEKGFLSCDFASVQVRYYDGNDLDHVFSKEERVQSFIREHTAFQQCVKGGGDPDLATAFDGVRALEIADELYRSSREGVMVRLAPQ